jgi:hypothetical protein
MLVNARFGKRRIPLRKIALAVAGVVLLSGCSASFRGEPELAFARQEGQPQDINRIAVAAALADANIAAAVGPNATVAQRNSIVLARMAEIDTLYNEYELALSQELREGRFTTALLGLGFGIGGTFASGGASQFLSAGSASVAGASEAFQKEILIERTVQSLTAQMRANRDNVKSNILIKLANDIDAYPTLAALSDVVAYRQAGTIVGGLLGIAENSANAEAQARDKLSTILITTRGRGIDITPSAREQLSRVRSRINAISDSEIVALANNPPSSNDAFENIRKAYLSGAQSFSNPIIARQAIISAIDAIEVENLGVWEAALGLTQSGVVQ